MLIQIDGWDTKCAQQFCKVHQNCSIQLLRKASSSLLGSSSTKAKITALMTALPTTPCSLERSTGSKVVDQSKQAKLSAHGTSKPSKLLRWVVLGDPRKGLCTAKSASPPSRNCRGSGPRDSAASGVGGEKTAARLGLLREKPLPKGSSTYRVSTPKTRLYRPAYQPPRQVTRPSVLAALGPNTGSGEVSGRCPPGSLP